MLGLSKSTVHVLCGTLLDLGLLARVGSAHFAIGPHALRWAGAFQSQSDLATEFNRVWDELNVLPEETVTLSILSGTDVVYHRLPQRHPSDRHELPGRHAAPGALHRDRQGDPQHHGRRRSCAGSSPRIGRPR